MRYSIVLLATMLVAGCSESTPTDSPIGLVEPTSPPPPSLDFPVPILSDDLSDFPLPPSSTLLAAGVGGTTSAMWETTTDYAAVLVFYSGSADGWEFKRGVSQLNAGIFTVTRDGKAVGELGITQGPPTSISLRRAAVAEGSTSPLPPIPLPTPLDYPRPSETPEGLPPTFVPTFEATLVSGVSSGGYVYAIWETASSLAAVIAAYEKQFATAGINYDTVTSASGTAFTSDVAIVTFTKIVGGTRFSLQAKVAP